MIQKAFVGICLWLVAALVGWCGYRNQRSSDFLDKENGSWQMFFAMLLFIIGSICIGSVFG